MNAQWLHSLVVFTILNFPVLTWSKDKPVEATSPALLCSQCSLNDNQLARLQNMREVLDEKIACNNTTDPSDCIVIQWAAEKYKLYPYCGKFFINPNGQLGYLSQLVAGQIAQDITTKKEESAFVKEYPDLVKICPGFKTMSATNKVSMWTWFFEILAFFESTCDPSKSNYQPDVPHGPARGLYQLEPRRSIRAWRGPHCDVPDSVILTAEGNTACAIDGLAGLLKRNGQLFGRRNKAGELEKPSQWYSLNEPISSRRNDRNHQHNRFLRYLPHFPLCQAPESQYPHSYDRNSFDATTILPPPPPTEKPVAKQPAKNNLKTNAKTNSSPKADPKKKDPFADLPPSQDPLLRNQQPMNSPLDLPPSQDPLLNRNDNRPD